MSLFAVRRMEAARIRRALRGLEATGTEEPGERARLLGELRARLEARRQREEEQLYPFLESDVRTRGAVRSFREEDGGVDALLELLTRTPCDDPRFGPRAEALRGAVEQCLEREECRLPACAVRALPPAELEDLGIQTRREVEVLEHVLRVRGIT